VLAFQIRPHRSPQSDRRNLLNSAHRDFKSKRVERVIDEIGAPPSQHAPCPPRAAHRPQARPGARRAHLQPALSHAGAPIRVSSASGCAGDGFSQRLPRGEISNPTPPMGKGRGFLMGFKGSRFKRDPLHTPPQGARLRHSLHEQGQRMIRCGIPRAVSKDRISNVTLCPAPPARPSAVLAAGATADHPPRSPKSTPVRTG